MQHTRVPRPRSFRSRLLIVLLVATLLVLPVGPLFVGARADVPQWLQRDERKGNPKRGKPEATLPNVDTMRTTRQLERELPDPVPSSHRSRKNAERPWDGRRVGEERKQIEGQAQQRSTTRNANAFSRTGAKE